MANVTDRRDGVSEGLAAKRPCLVATTANTTLSGTQTIDGVAVAIGDRVLVKSQTTASENGIYVVANGSWTRAADFDGDFDIVTGTMIFVTSGTLTARTLWYVSTTDPITIGTTSITLSQIAGAIITNGLTGTDAFVLASAPTITSPTLVTAVLGTPASGTLTNCTGLPISSGVSGLGSGVAAFLATPSSSNLKTAITDETGSGSLVFATSPTLVTPDLGTPTSGTLTNCTGLPISSGVSGLASNVATWLGTPTSANLAAALTDETGSGALVFATSPTLVTPALGTPSSGVLTNCTGLPLSGHVNQAAYTLVGNATGSSAAPTAFTIAGLTHKASPAGTDRMLISDEAASSALKYSTITEIIGSSVAGVSTFVGRSGAVVATQGDYSTALIPGTTTNDSATAGNIGEYVEGSLVAGSSTSISFLTPKNVISISLTAGDWDVSGNVVFNNLGATGVISWTQAGISTTSATMPTTGLTSNNLQIVNESSTTLPNNFGTPVGPVRMSLSGTNTVYLIAQINGTGTPTINSFGEIRARRVR